MGKRYENWLRRSDLLSRAAMSRVEAVLAGILLLGLGLVVFGSHVSRGDFTLDDWAFRADYAQHGYWGLIERLLDLEPGLSEPAAGGRGRLLGTLFYATSYAALGSDAALHLLLALLLGVLMSFLLFLVLRKLRVERLHAGLIAALVLVFPAADAPRLWPAAAPAQLAIALFLLGLLLALGALEQSGRAAVARHAASVVCYVLALLTYEYPFVAILLAVFVYRLKAPWRPSLQRWIVDVGAAALVAGYSRFVARASDVAPLSTQIDNARAIQDHARTLLSRLGIQDGQALVPLELLALLLAAAGALAFLLPRSDPFRQDLRRWVVTAFAGIVAVGAGYVVLLPISGHLPLNPGVANRINIGAAIGYVLVIYALAVLFGTLTLRAVAVVRPVPQPRVWAGLVGAALTLFVGALWTAAAVDDRRDWERAGELRRETLDSLREVPRPRPSSTVYTFGVPGATAPGIFTFAAPYDLIGAVRVLWDDHSLAAIPAPNLERDFWGVNTGDNWGISCTPSAVRPHGYGYSEENASPFGSVVFVDVPGGRHVVVRDRDECRAWASRYQLLRN